MSDTTNAASGNSATQDTLDALGFGKMAKSFADNVEQSEAMLTAFFERAQNTSQDDLDPLKLQEPFAAFMQAFAQDATSDPQKTAERNLAFMQNSMNAWQQMSTGYLKMLNQAINPNAGEDEDQAQTAPEPVIRPEPGDRRFKHEAWDSHPLFRHIRDNYLLMSRWVRDSVAQTEGLDEATQKKIAFFTERYLDALAPTNFVATNPAVLERMVETKGASLLHGTKNMLEDIEAGNGQLKIRMTDTNAFKMGENIATTPGKVVFQNRMHQLIQYSPSTDSAFKKPLLVVPPWINKFYILDLQPKNSFLKWLVDQGHTVFVLSWVNPDESYADVGFDAYVKDGVLAALDAIEQATGEKNVNAIGYCLGGTLLATTLAYMAANNDDRIDSATFLTTMLNFSEPGDLGCFIGEKEIDALDEKMFARGYLDGGEMAGTFNLLRANDLIWSFYINNYLMGFDARPFDLLYWNSDSTRMPAKMHSWYLRNLYLNNLLKEPGALEIDGTPIDLGAIKTPVCLVSTEEDHIAPWQSTYSGLELFSGSKRFILGGSGHIAGIVNPPAAEKYGYKVTSKPPKDGEKWAAGAKKHEGSWWPNWQEWVKPKAGKQVDSRTPGDGKLDVIEDAPGCYVSK